MYRYIVYLIFIFLCSCMSEKSRQTKLIYAYTQKYKYDSLYEKYHKLFELAQAKQRDSLPFYFQAEEQFNRKANDWYFTIDKLQHKILNKKIDNFMKTIAK